MCVCVCVCGYDLLLIMQLGKPSPESFKSHPIFTMFASPCLAGWNATLKRCLARLPTLLKPAYSHEVFITQHGNLFWKQIYPSHQTSELCATWTMEIDMEKWGLVIVNHYPGSGPSPQGFSCYTSRADISSHITNPHELQKTIIYLCKPVMWKLAWFFWQCLIII